MKNGTRRAISAVVLAFFVIAGAVVVLTADGYESTKVDLNDAGIWISKVTEAKEGHAPGWSVGRLNMEVEDVDTAIGAGSPKVLQSGSTMIVQDAGSLTSINVADPSRPPVVAARPAGSQIGLGGPTLAVLDPVKGGLHMVLADGLEAGSFQGEGLEVDKTARMAVGTDGVVHLVEGGRIESYAVGERRPKVRSISREPGTEVQVSAAGARSLVFDDEQRLFIDGGSPIDLSEFGGDLRLQQPSEDDDVVVLAGRRDLVEVAVDNGTPISVFHPSSGADGVVEPVRVAGCSYGAWITPGEAAAACAGAESNADPYPFGQGHEVEFRVNHRRVTLNDVQTGDALIIDVDPHQKIDGTWSEALTVLPEEQAQNPEDGEDRATNDTSSEDLEANPISVAARVGRPRSINALDYAPGALYVSGVTRPSGGTAFAAPGRNGQTIELDPAAATPGGLSFDYTVADGKGGTATGKVTVRLLAEDAANTPPTTRPDVITVRPGGTAVVNVLANDDDPEGDGLLLSAARADDGTLTGLQFSPDGVISVRAGDMAGTTTVTYTAVDDLGSSREGQLQLTVAQDATVVARDDFALGHVGQEIAVRAVANDLSPGGPLRIGAADVQGGAADRLQERVRSDAEIRYVANAPGSYEVHYTAVDDETGASAPGIIRLVVAESEGAGPITARDTAAVAVDVPVVIPVLANDSDPDGDVLALMGVTASSLEGLRARGIEVEVLKREFLRVTIRQPIPLNEPFTFRYDVTDGTSDPVTGAVLLRGLIGSVDQPPIAADDLLTLRPNMVGAARVLDNDLDPEGGQLTLSLPEVGTGVDAGQSGDLPCTTRQGEDCTGMAFVQGDVVRVVAPALPGSFTVTYTALDPGRNHGGGVLQVEVVDRDNRPPLPSVTEARTAVGKPIPIQIPVVGSDPDGDVVSLVGVASAPRHGTLPTVDDEGFVLDGGGGRAKVPNGPRKGEAITVPANGLWYVPSVAGTDEFTYTVRDAAGLEGRGTVRIAVVPNTSNSAPIAVPDRFEAIPGKSLEANVVVNDSDPEGDDIVLVDDPSLWKGIPGVKGVRTDSGVILVRAQGAPGDHIAVPYRIQDSLGQTAESTLIVAIVEETKGAPPVAVDDVLPAAAPGEQVAVATLQNDADPDGDLTAVDVTPKSVPGVGARWIDGREFRFEMPEEPVQFRYTITDKDGNSASAFVTVPLRVESELRTVMNSVEVEPGGSVEIPVVEDDLPRGDVELKGILQQPNAGTTTILGNGRVVYQASPDSDATTDGFTYEVQQSSNPTKTLPGAVSITIRSKENRPPAMSSRTLELSAGRDATADLGALVTDPDGGEEFRFEKVGGDPNKWVTASIGGSTLTVKATRDAYAKSSGQVAPVRIRVVDSGGLEAQGEVRIMLRATDTPVPVVNNDRYDVIRSKGAFTMAVLDNDTGSELELLGVGQPPSGEGSVSPSGNTVVYTPPADSDGTFAGTTSFSYRVGDDSDEPSHEVTGTVTVNVVGRPSKPGRPTASTADIGSRQVTLRWPTAMAKGAPIESYAVRADGFGGQTCPTSPCTITGLTNGTPYRFTVVAKASFDGTALEGEPSDPSEPLEPNRLPDPSTFTETTANDQGLTVEWADVQNQEGTAITKYELVLVPADAPAQTVQAGTHTATFTGLKNKTSYKVRLKTFNKVGEATPVESADIVPYGKPIFAPGGRPQATAGDGQISVSWPGADPNGSPITEYTVTPSRGGSQTVRGATTTVFKNLENGIGYTFTVTATNARGASLPIGPSVEVKASGKPQTVGTVTATAGNGRATLKFTAPDANGSPITSYKVTVNGAVRTLTGAGTGQVSLEVTGLANGTEYGFTVAACNQNPSQVQCGDAGTSNRVTPYGPPEAPRVGVNSPGVGDYTLSWNWAPNGDGGKAVTGYELVLDGQSAGSTGSTSFSRSFGANESHTLQVRAVNGPGSFGPYASATGRTGAAPPPPKPRASDLIVVTYGGGEVGVAFNVSWDAGRDPVTCHFFRDGVEVFTAQCGIRSSNRFYGVPAGTHSWYATVSDREGVYSDPTNTVSRYND